MKYLVFSIKCIIILGVFGILNTKYQIPNTVYADSINLSIQPSNLQINAKSPADIRAPFTLTNQGLSSVTVTIVLKTFRGAGDDTGKIIYTDSKLTSDDDKDSFLKTVQILDDGFAVSSLTLGPKQQKQLQLRVNLPNDSKSQDHYFSLVFLTQPGTSNTIAAGPDTKETTSIAQPGIALPILFAVNRGKDPTGFLDDFSGPLFTQAGPVPFNVRVENTGDHFIEARGVIFIKNMFGQIVGKVELPPTNILAGSTRLLENSSDVTTESLGQKAVWDEGFLLGFYTATLTLAISPDQSLYTRSSHFVAFPVVGLVGIFLIVCLSIFVVYRIKKKISQE